MIKKIALRILLGLLLFTVGAVLVLAGLIAYDTWFPNQRVTDLTNVTYTNPEGLELHGYLAEPTGNKNGAGILLIHEFYGLNQDIINKADLLAAQGYTVLAADSYRGQTTSLIPRAIFLVVSTPRDQIALDLDTAFQYLSTRPNIDASRIGTLGFCFGGTQVMWMATRNPQVAATAIFYGSGPITDPAQLGVMPQGGPVLGVYGQDDSGIPTSEVDGFEAAMRSQGMQPEITIYPGVGHAFVNSQNISQAGAAQQAWQQMLQFFAVHIGG